MRTLMNVAAVVIFVAAGLEMIDGNYLTALALAMSGTVAFLLRVAFAVPGRD